MSDEIKTLIEDQGKAFAAFKEAHAAELKKADAVVAEKLARIEKSLDAAVEAKAAIEEALAAERKEREELEARLNRTGGGAKDDNTALELKSFNDVLQIHASERGQKHEAMSAEGYAAYKAAFEAMLRKNDKQLDPAEVKTLSVGSDPDGGYLVTPDMSGRIVKRIYETSPMRQIATVVAIGTDALEGLEDTGEAGAGYAGEQTQGSDTTTPNLAKYRIPVHIIDTEPKATQKILDDATLDVTAWLSGKVADKFARFEAAEFITGSANRIRGLALGYPVAADSGSGVTWGSVGYVASGASGAFASSNPADKIFDLIGCLKQAYLTNARFLTRRSVITAIRKLKDGQGNYLWQPSLVAGQPEQIAGYPVTLAEDMPALASDSYSMAFGDFAEAYTIVDRHGIRVLRDPYTSKPFVKFYTTKRVGGGVVNFEAYKLMKFGSS